MGRLLAVCLLGISVMACTAGTSDDTEEPSGESNDALTKSFVSKGTGYYPANTRMEGGTKDRLGKPLYTLQQFLAGDAPYVAVAMDTNAFKYGTKLSIKELNDKYNTEIEFRVVDTGGAFRGKGRTRIDICTKDRTASLDPTINRVAGLHITVTGEADDD